MEIEVARETTIAELAESTERYDDMMKSVEKIVEIKRGLLDYSQRNLLSVAYKNVLAKKYFALRAMSTIECSLSSRDELDHKGVMRRQLVAEYKGKIMDDYKSICDEVLVCILWSHTKPLHVNVY